MRFAALSKMPSETLGFRRHFYFKPLQVEFFDDFQVVV